MAKRALKRYAEDPAGLYAHIYPQKIKVDATPPHGMKIVGFQNGNELPMGETHLKVEATDGEGSTKSSGIKSIKVSIDGHEVSRIGCVMSGRSLYGGHGIRVGRA